MAGTKLKTVFWATILAAILVIVITICIILIPTRPCTQIDPIVHLQMVQTDDTLRVTWAEPFGHGNCPMTYRIQLSNGTHLIWLGETVVPSYSFSNITFRPCLSNIVAVYAVTYMRFANVTGSSSSFVHFGNIGPVTNLQVLEENNGWLTASWDPPIDSELCTPLSYEVKLGEVQEPNVTFDTAFTFEEVNSRPCVANRIVVTPLGVVNAEGESLRGQAENHSHFGEVGPVEDLVIELQGSFLLVSWSPPIDSEECQLAYNVTLSYEDEFIEYQTQVNYHNFDVPALISCVISNISVTPIATVGDEEVRGLEARAVHLSGLGPIASLELIQQDSGLFASWEAPPNSEYCGTITYEVVLETSDGIIQESDLVHENLFVFEQANLQPCTISVVSITPLATVNDEITLRGETYTYAYFADIGPVENLVIAQSQGALLVNWLRPVVSPDCPLTYEITLWYNQEVAGTATTDSLGHIFEDADVRPCVVNEVSVIPIASKDLREGKGPETRRRHLGEIGPVTNFQLTLNQDNLLVASWTAPIASELCELTYEILLQTSEGEVPQIFSANQLEYVFSGVDPRPCVAYTVTITSVTTLEGGQVMRGLQDTQQHVADIGAIEDLEVNQIGNSLLVTWGRPLRSELCLTVTYEVTLTFGGEVLHQVQTIFEEHAFTQANLQPCTQYQASVIPTGQNHDQGVTTEGPEVSQPYFVAVGPVQNLMFQGEPFGISWAEPINSGACVLAYHIQIETRDENVTLEGYFYPLEDIPCYYYAATVTPIVLEGQGGPPQMVTHEVPPATEIGPVQNLDISENAFVWEPPINAGVCNVTYQLVVTINGVPTFVETTDQIFEGLPPCSTAMIEITAATADGGVSAPLHLEVNVPLLGLGPVDNLEFLDDRVQWERPLSSGVCPLEYRLTHAASGSESETLILSETHFLIDLMMCSHHEVSVYAFYEGEGEENIVGSLASAEIYLPNEATLIGQVQNLVVNETGIGLVEWLPPTGIDPGTCTITYSIVIDRGFDVLHHNQVGTSFQIPDVPCANNEVTVHAIVDGFSGAEATVNYQVPSAAFLEDPPENVNYSTTFNSVTTVWRVTTPLEINACQIITFIVWIEHAGIINVTHTPVSDNKDRIFVSENGDLLPDTDYVMWTATHIFLPDHGNVESERLFFRTDSPPAETEVFMKLTWDPPTDPFVSGYEVAIQDNGPAHFLPSYCVENNPEEKNIHAVIGNTAEFLFSSYLPSHNYTILVTSLGASANYVFEEVTPEARPGAPSLSYEFLEGDDGNDVTAVITWPIPCDVNGKLVKFSVEMEGLIEQDVFAEDGRVNYSVEIQRLSKGSVHTVRVQTHLKAHRSEKGAFTFKTPDGP